MKKKSSLDGSESYFVRRTFSCFFVPSLLSMLGLALGGLADCLFVGNRVGAAGLAAIGLGAPVYLFYSLVSIGASIGGSIHYAAALSRGDAEEGNGIFNRVLRFVLAFDLLTAALGLLLLPELLSFLGAAAGDDVTAAYVRAQLICAPVMFCQAPFYYFVHNDGAPGLAAAAMMTASIVDILLNALFVLGLGLGAVGSVYSTAAGALCNILICMLHLLRRRGCLRFRLRPCARGAAVLAVRTGFASSVSNLYQFVIVLVLNRLLMERVGILGVAIFDVISNVSVLISALVDSVGLTLQPMVSTYLGEQNLSSIRQTMTRALGRALLLCSATALALALTARWYCPLFGLSEGESLRQGVAAIVIFCLSVPFAACNGTMIYFYQSVERERRAYLLYLLRSLALALPAALLLLPPPLERFWWFYLIAEAGTFALLCVLALRKNVMNELTAAFGDRVQPALVRRMEDIGPAAERMGEFLEQSGSSPAKAMAASLVMEELCGAIMEHAQSADTYIQATLVREADGFTLHIRDNALRFNPFELRTETGDLLSAGDSALSSLGMKIVLDKTRGFFYRRYAGFNTLTVKL